MPKEQTKTETPAKDSLQRPGSAVLLERIEKELGSTVSNEAIMRACIMTRLHERFQARPPTRAEVHKEADAWLAEFKGALSITPNTKRS